MEENKIKTKIRRLYDIANVLNALGLIKKTSIHSTSQKPGEAVSRKPAFKWVGLIGLERFS
jgi:transcription factor E2F7/8